MRETAEVTLKLGDIAQIHPKEHVILQESEMAQVTFNLNRFKTEKSFFRTSQEVREQMTSHPRHHQLGIYCINEAQRLQAQRIE